MQNTKAIVQTVKDREKFIAENLRGVPDAYTDSHLGLVPEHWQSQAETIKQRVAADLQQHSQDNPPPPATTKPPGKYDFIKMPNS